MSSLTEKQDLTLLFLKEDLKDCIWKYAFDLNNEATREKLAKEITKIVDAGAAHSFYYGYKVICDETNNTEETRNDHKLIADVQIQFEPSLKPITVNVQMRCDGVFSLDDLNGYADYDHAMEIVK